MLGLEARPFVKWAGSKRWLARRAQELLPSRFDGDYYEPFLGSGSIFFAIHQPVRHHYLSDALEPLVNCYVQIAADPLLVAEIANGWGTTSADYYDVRSMTFDDDAHRAAKFLYFNRLCFNGLYRVNSSGRFNVPYGRPKSHKVVGSLDALLDVAKVLNSAVTIKAQDFGAAIEQAKAGDLIYADPPYISGHRQNGFADYNARVFSWDDQRRLAELLRAASARGVNVLVSNADHASIRSLYPGFHAMQLHRFSSMSSNAGARGKSTELLISNYEIELPSD